MRQKSSPYIEPTRGRFALDERGEWQPSIKSTIVVGRSDGAPVAYLCGVLNSELLDLWYAVRGKTPRDVWRNYEPLRMNEMPYRAPDGDERAERIAGLVRRIAENRRDLLPHRPVVRDLERTVKDPWRTPPVEVDRAVLVAELPATQTVSVRLDRDLEREGNLAARGKLVRVGPDAIVLKSGRTEAAKLRGEPRRLDLVEELVGSKPTDSLSEVLLPRDLDEFEDEGERRRMQVEALLAEGRKLVEEVERLVCGLYEVPDELMDEIVAHAMQRAER